ncbi:hypothetical protein [Williamsia deligens]|uniref:Uncharacterized protein n=1 Tax=Williamsia deligens TaxID=321325 RepID=A0ABW3GH68_9NOCA|nr:hypothetical protein [Williamsia deligens]MCP2196301.1 hypothetical protein [Williamsia deligens]
MTGTLASLRDWIRDQVHEIRHLAPHAVLAPAKCTPVGHVLDADLPDPEAIAPCEWTIAGERVCDDPADWAIRLHVHVPFVWLLCDHHLEYLKQLWLDDFAKWPDPLRCAICGHEFRMLKDAIVSEARL